MGLPASFATRPARRETGLLGRELARREILTNLRWLCADYPPTSVLASHSTIFVGRPSLVRSKRMGACPAASIAAHFRVPAQTIHASSVAKRPRNPHESDLLLRARFLFLP